MGVDSMAERTFLAIYTAPSVSVFRQDANELLATIAGHDVGIAAVGFENVGTKVGVTGRTKVSGVTGYLPRPPSGRD
jgi:hypothetical protein